MYSYVVRKVDRFQQYYIKQEYELQLFTTQVKCNARSFTLEQVLDISYKPFSSEKDYCIYILIKVFSNMKFKQIPQRLLVNINV